MVDALVSLSCDSAVRHPFWISCLLGPCRLPDVLLHAAPIWALRPCGSAVRRGSDVDRRDAHLPRPGRDSLFETPRPAKFACTRFATIPLIPRLTFVRLPSVKV